MLLREYEIEIFNSKCQPGAEGAKGMERCIPIADEKRKQIEAYMTRFVFG